MLIIAITIEPENSFPEHHIGTAEAKRRRVLNFVVNNKTTTIIPITTPLINPFILISIFIELEGVYLFPSSL